MSSHAMSQRVHFSCGLRAKYWFAGMSAIKWKKYIEVQKCLLKRVKPLMSQSDPQFFKEGWEVIGVLHLSAETEDFILMLCYSVTMSEWMSLM